MKKISKLFSFLVTESMIKYLYKKLSLELCHVTIRSHDYVRQVGFDRPRQT